MTVRVTRLANGLTVASDPMSGVESVSVGVWVGVGTRHETKAVNGVSHLLEHMAFKGTRRRSARDIAEQIEAVGGHLNAYTSRENTAFYARVLKDDLALAVDILADILQESVFDPDELAREQAVVVQEIGQANDTPDDIIFDIFQETAYPDQPVGWPVLGSEETVRGLSRDRVAAYMRRHYAGPAMILAAAGAVDHDRLVALAEEAFGKLPPSEPALLVPAAYRGGEHREARDLEQVHVVLGFNGFAYEDRDFYSSQVLCTLLGGGMSSRLFQEIREARGLVYSIYSFTASYVDGGLFAVYAGTGEDELAEMMPVICDEMKKVTDKVTPEEVSRARAQLRASTLMSLESASSRCEQLARQLLVFGRPLPVSEIVSQIEAVDGAAVVGAAQRLLDHPPTLTALGPVSGLPAFDALTARLR